MVSLIYSEWRWADDTAEFTMDKEAHFAASGGVYFFFRHKDYTEKESILYSFYLGLTKECIDAVLPWEKYGRWGGDGFSKYDLAYNLAGIGTAYFIDKIWKTGENNNDFTIRFNNDSISFCYWIH
jgi:hypothetical protein